MIQSVKGMHDLLPDESEHMRRVGTVVTEALSAFGYREICLPLLESAELFSRSLGEATDIVEKEMYVFEDQGGDRLALRPEGTAGCVRAGLEHGLLRTDARHRLWYSGAFFRRERPQKGRYRQFRQVGAEAFGFAGPDLDAELITAAALAWERLGIAGGLTLRLNTLGDAASRSRYREALVAYLAKNESRLDDNARKRIHTNPLRVLDSKDERTIETLSDAPRLPEYLDEESAQHFAALKSLLAASGVAFEEDERLVRGLDYYTRTVFEWVAPGAGAQNAVCAGGRYDSLVEMLGGPAVPAAGFAVGLERVAALVAPAEASVSGRADAYVVAVGEAAKRAAHRLAADLRRAFPGRCIVVHCGGGGFRAQMKCADKSGAAVALLLGDDELERGVVTLKPLRDGGEQLQLPAEQVGERLSTIIPAPGIPAKAGTRPG